MKKTRQHGLYFSPSAPPLRVYYSVRNQTFLEKRLCSSRVIYIANMMVALTVLFFWSLTAGHSMRSFGARFSLLGRAIREGSSGKLGVRDAFFRYLLGPRRAAYRKRQAEAVQAL